MRNVRRLVLKRRKHRKQLTEIARLLAAVDASRSRGRRRVVVSLGR
jgi:hypothetical protein